MSACLGPAAALAEPSPSDACAFFASLAKIEMDPQGIPIVFAGEQVSIVGQSEVSLERYETIEIEILREFGTTLTSGEYAKVGALSEHISCNVDIKDRRVLVITVSAGAMTGKGVEIKPGKINKIIGANPASFTTGLEIHQGKY